MTRSVDLPALLGSRICHDLISPLGAISNGVELLTMSGVDFGPELALISESVENANARIKFFRVAFGAADEAQQIGAPEASQILGDLTSGGRLQVDWQLDAPAPRREVKLAFLLIQCLETAMPWGGTVRVARGEDGRWRVDGRAERMQVDPGLWEALSLPEAGSGLSAAEVQFLLVPGLVRDLDRSLTLEIGDGAILARY